MSAAVALFGREGVSAVTVRKIAAAADVSAALVIHHFGSKDGLVEACDAHVWSLVEQSMETLIEQGSSAAMQSIWVMEDMGEAIAYIGRSMQDDRAVGRRWFEQLVATTIAGLDEMAAHGAARPSDDPTMRALLLVVLDLGMVTMRSLVERALGADLTDPDVIRRWVHTEFDLLTHGVLIEKGDDR